MLREVKYPEYQALRKWKTTLSVLIININTSISGKDGWSCPNNMWKERSGFGVRNPEFSSIVIQSCLTLFDWLDYSKSCFPVHHQIPEHAQTHVHWVSDVIKQFHPLLPPSLLPSNFPSIRVFSNESVLHIRWPKYWNCSFSISPSNEYSGLISFRIDWFDLLAVQGTCKSLLQHHDLKTSILQHSAFFMVQLSHPCMTTGKIIALTRWNFVGKVSAF